MRYSLMGYLLIENPLFLKCQATKLIFPITFSLFALGEHIITHAEHIFALGEYKNANGKQSLSRKKRRKSVYPDKKEEKRNPTTGLHHSVPIIAGSPCSGASPAARPPVFHGLAE